jgi:hypothetical protein
MCVLVQILGCYSVILVADGLLALNHPTTFEDFISHADGLLALNEPTTLRISFHSSAR